MQLPAPNLLDVFGCISKNHMTVISRLRRLPPPFGAYGTTFAPVGSVSLDFRVTTFPYESSSLATPQSGGTIKLR